jgi:stage II sporulation protein D
MRPGRWIVLFVALALGACAAPAPHLRLPGSAARQRPVTLRVQVREEGRLVVRRVPLEEYVAAAILSEVDPPAGDPRVVERMYEVQAVVARTYALSQLGRHGRDGFDVCSTTHCQLYEPSRLRGSKWADAVREAVRRTSGEVLFYGGAPARAVFHADCGGHTSNAAAVWGGAAPAYLEGEPDEGPAARAHARWTVEATSADLRRALNGDPRTQVGARLDDVRITSRDAAGRAEQVTLRGARTVTVRGEVFREAVSRALGVSSLRSTLFTVEWRRNRYVFTGRGFGHGVGLCQAGALARLTAGASPNEVLAFYYPGTRIVSD